MFSVVNKGFSIDLVVYTLAAIQLMFRCVAKFSSDRKFAKNTGGLNVLEVISSSPNQLKPMTFPNLYFALPNQALGIALKKNFIERDIKLWCYQSCLIVGQCCNWLVDCLIGERSKLWEQRSSPQWKVSVIYVSFVNHTDMALGVTGRGGRISRALVSRAGDCGFKPRLSQINDL